LEAYWQKKPLALLAPLAKESPELLLVKRSPELLLVKRSPQPNKSPYLEGLGYLSRPH
jgi:hypothetical protein